MVSSTSSSPWCQKWVVNVRFFRGFIPGFYCVRCTVRRINYLLAGMGTVCLLFGFWMSKRQSVCLLFLVPIPHSMTYTHCFRRTNHWIFLLRIPGPNTLSNSMAKNRFWRSKFRFAGQEMPQIILPYSQRYSWTRQIQSMLSGAMHVRLIFIIVLTFTSFFQTVFSLKVVWLKPLNAFLTVPKRITCLAKLILLEINILTDKFT